MIYILYMYAPTKVKKYLFWKLSQVQLILYFSQDYVPELHCMSQYCILSMSKYWQAILQLLVLIKRIILKNPAIRMYAGLESHKIHSLGSFKSQQLTSICLSLVKFKTKN